MTLRRKLKARVGTMASGGSTRKSLSRTKQTHNKDKIYPNVDDLDTITPKTLLKKIIQNEPEVSMIVSQKSDNISIHNEQYLPLDNSIHSMKNLDLNLSELDEHNCPTVFGNAHKKRRVSITHFERGVEERLPQVKENSLSKMAEQIGNLSAMGNQSVVPRTITTDLCTPVVAELISKGGKGGLIRRPKKFHLVSLEDFEQGVENNYQHLKGSQECFVESTEGEESDISSNEMAGMNTELYAHPVIKKQSIVKVYPEQETTKKELVSSIDGKNDSVNEFDSNFELLNVHILFVQEDPGQQETDVSQGMEVDNEPHTSGVEGPHHVPEEINAEVVRKNEELIFTESHIQTSNILLGEAGKTSHILPGKAGETSNILLGEARETSNILLGEAGKTSHILPGKAGETSNILLGEARETSNILLGEAGKTSHILPGKAGETSNILLGEARETSNNLLGEARETSNILLGEAGKTSNILLGEAGKTSHILLGEARETSHTLLGEEGETSNILLGEASKTSNILLGEASKTSNILLGEAGETSNILLGEAGETSNILLGEEGETSNILLGVAGETSHSLPGKAGKTSNILLGEAGETSHILPGKAGETSNILLGEAGETSNILLGEAGETSNILLGEASKTSNILLGEAGKTSHILLGVAGETSHILPGKAGETSNILLGKARETSNILLGEASKTSNILLGEAGKTSNILLGEAGKTSNILLGQASKTSNILLGETEVTTVPQTLDSHAEDSASSVVDIHMHRLSSSTLEEQKVQQKPVEMHGLTDHSLSDSQEDTELECSVMEEHKIPKIQTKLSPLQDTRIFFKNAKFRVNKNITVAKRTQKKKTEIGQKREILPSTFTKQIFSHYAQFRISKECYKEVDRCLEIYFGQLSSDLAAYTDHANRKTINRADIELLMKRHGLVTDTIPLNVLIEKYLPLEYRKLLIPCAMSGNKVFPKL
ncbi:centromere protein T isoform X2 [Pelobates fuscus]